MTSNTPAPDAQPPKKPHPGQQPPAVELLERQPLLTLWGRKVWALPATFHADELLDLADFIRTYWTGPEAIDGYPVLLPIAADEDAETVLTQVGMRALEFHPDGPPAHWDHAALLTRTSGSTAQDGKIVCLSREALRASIQGTWNFLAQSRDDSTPVNQVETHWVLPLSPAHIAGLLVLARATLAEEMGWGESHLWAICEGEFTQSFINTTNDLTPGPAFTSLVPTQLKRLLDTEEGTKAAQRYEMILLGGAPATSELLEKAANLGVKVTTTYGASETAGGCFYNGHPIPTEPATLASLDPNTGRIAITGPTLFCGYLTVEDDLYEDEHGRTWWLTSDLGEAGPPLKVTGRYDYLINTGGLKIDPALVEKALTSHPEIQDALVCPVADEEWGQMVCALIVPELEELPEGMESTAYSAKTWAASEEEIESLNEHVRQLVDAPAVPKHYLWAGSIPLKGIGKPDRNRASQYLAQSYQNRQH
ncbi:AMP-binding protein [Boudabousia liubingyangii]|uniref:AMP-binding protein n=1 Tax=Boudabousia liubingyangii TaxID=1921764 RepID=UPI000A44E6A6|nr:AMP-binding protein [Boudabousia liubingyangii]